MKQNSRKLLSILLALALLLGVFTLQTGAVFAEDEETVGDTTFTDTSYDEGEGDDLWTGEEIDLTDYFHTDEPGDEMRALKPMFSAFGTTNAYFSGTPDQVYVLTEKNGEPDWSLAVTPDEEESVIYEDLKPATEYVLWTRVAETEEHPAGEPIAIPFATGLDSHWVNGDLLIGSTLTIGYDPAEAEGLSFHWHYDTWEENEDGVRRHTYVPIEGATDRSYTLTEADLDKYIGFEIISGDTVVAETDNLYDEPVSYASVIYDTRGGSEIPNAEGLVYGDPIPKPEDPVREGYTFAGWYIAPDTDYETEYVFEGKTIEWSYNIVEAKWIPLEGYALTAEYFTEDVSADDWYYDAVDFVAKKGWIRGFGYNYFGAEEDVSRDMATLYLWNAAGRPAASSEAVFDDFGPDYELTRDAVNWGVEEGVVEGYGDGLFGPDDSVTREQFIAMLYRHAVKSGLDVSVGEDTNILDFVDAFDIDSWAVPAFQWAVGAGLVEGRGEGVLAPLDLITRAEIATLLMRYTALTE